MSPRRVPVSHLLAASLVAVRAGGRLARTDFERAYQWLAELTRQHGSIRLYEEAPGWTGSVFVSQLHGIVPDLRYGPRITVRRYAAVGDTVWARLMYHLWRGITPVWPLAPHRMRYFPWAERESAWAWLDDSRSMN